MNAHRSGEKRLVKSDPSYYSQLDFRMGYANVTMLLALGALAAVLIGCTPVLWLFFNKVIRFIATIGVRYAGYRDPALAEFAVLLPDLVMLALFGAGAAYARMYSVKRNRFYMLRVREGTIRVGLDDAFSLLIGTPLIWFMFFRHGWGTLFFITGANHLLFPFLGYVLGSIWRDIYRRLVARLAPVPDHKFVPATLWHTYHTTTHMAEMFRLQHVGWDNETATLTLTGHGSALFREKQGEADLKQYIRNIQVVAEGVRTIHVVDLPAAAKVLDDRRSSAASV